MFMRNPPDANLDDMILIVGIIGNDWGVPSMARADEGLYNAFPWVLRGARKPRAGSGASLPADTLIMRIIRVEDLFV
jgi:hypothetical protein